MCYHYTTSHYPVLFVDKRPALPASYLYMWGGIWGSNPRHPEPQSGALPTELIPPFYTFGTPREIRTPDLLLRRQLLYPAELLALIYPPAQHMERVMGIEPTYPAWKAGVLPLNYTRMAVPSFSLEIIPYFYGRCQYAFEENYLFPQNILSQGRREHGLICRFCGFYSWLQPHRHLRLQAPAPKKQL